MVKERCVEVKAVRLSVDRCGKEVGHVYLYLLVNDLHDEFAGLVEDLSVDGGYQGQGIGGELMTAVIKRAKLVGCYKLVATSREDGTRDAVHAWYEKLGFEDYGKEFRMNFNSD